MEYKKSAYLVISDAVMNGKYRIAYSTRTANTLLLASETVKHLEAGCWDEIDDAVFSELLRFEMIVPRHENELHTIIARNKQGVNDRDTLYYVIQPTAMCQLGCHYCGQQHTKDYLSESAYPMLLKRLEFKLLQKEYKHVNIGWFGAEPLMAINHIRTLTPQFRDLANKFGCTYSAGITTNGLSLKKNIFKELAALNITEIEITLDGSAEYHDNRRHTKSGEKTFDIIFGNLVDICTMPDFNSYRTDIVVRCNVDSTNHQGVTELMDLLVEKNIHNKIAKFYVAPIHSWGNDAHLMSLEKEAFAQFEMNILLRMYKLGFRTGLIPHETKPVVCMTVTNDAELVDAFGNVYNCTEVSYVPTYEGQSYSMGNLRYDADNIATERPMSGWYDDVKDSKFPCAQCRILPICGGSCPKSWYEGNPACPSIKYNIQDRLLLYFKRNIDLKKIAVAETAV